MTKLLLLLLLATVQTAEGQLDCSAVLANNIGPSIGFIFDFAAGTALLNSRSLVLSKLNSSIFNNGFSDPTGNSPKVISTGSFCSASFAATVAQPSTAITECQASDGTNFPSPLSCPLLTPVGNMDKFISCLNGLSQNSAPSDLISALSRVWNNGNNCNGMFNDNQFLAKPCLTTSPPANYAANSYNVLVIFWSSPIADPNQVATWLTKFYADNYINIIVVPFVGTSGSSASKADFEAIQKAWNDTQGPVGNDRMAIYPPVTPTAMPTTTPAPPPVNANDIDNIMAYLQMQIIASATIACPSGDLDYTQCCSNNTALAKTVCSIYADPNGNASAPATNATKVTLNDNQCSPPN